MLDDGNRGRIEVIGGAKRCIDIDVVVVRHLFATEQLGLCNAT